MRNRLAQGMAKKRSPIKGGRRTDKRKRKRKRIKMEVGGEALEAMGGNSKFCKAMHPMQENDKTY